MSRDDESLKEGMAEEVERTDCPEIGFETEWTTVHDQVEGKRL